MSVRDMENSHGRGAKGRRGDAVFGIGASFSQSSSLDKSPSRPTHGRAVDTKKAARG